MMKKIFLPVFVFMLAACSANIPAPDLTSTPLPSLTPTFTQTPLPTFTNTPEPTPAATEISAADKFLAEFDGLAEADTYETIMHTTAAELLAATGAENPTFQHVAAMLNKYGNEHTTWSPGTPYVTLLEVMEFNKGTQALTLGLTEAPKLPKDVPLSYKVMEMEGNFFGLPGNMTLITMTWPVEGGKNMSVTMMTDGDVAKEQLKLLTEMIGLNRTTMMMPQFYTSAFSSDIFKEEMVMKAEKVKVNVVVNPNTGEKQNIKLEDLWLVIARKISASETSTFIPLTSASRKEIQGWLDLAIYVDFGMNGTSSFKK